MDKNLTKVHKRRYVSESVNHIDCILFALNNPLKLEKVHTSQM